MTLFTTTNVVKKVFVLVTVFAMLVTSVPALFLPAEKEADAAGREIPFSWDNATVYFVMTDRFFDGDPSNNHSLGRELDAGGKPYPGYQDKIGSFHGGDLKGLTMKMNDGYFSDLGVNAIWITSPLEQIHGYVGGYSFRHYGYHGYFPLDFTELDPNMGNENDFRTFVDTAHSKGIRVILDVVINHVGYGDLITMNKYGFGDTVGDWYNYYYNRPEPDAHFDNYTKFIANKDQASWAKWWGPDWVRAHNTPGYDPCGTSELDMCLANLPDIKTESTKEVGLPPIMLTKWNAAKEAKEIAELDAFFKRTGKKRTVANHMIKWITDWVREYGIDGFRLDTAKHVENEVWADLKDEATIALREWKANNPTKKIDDADFWMTGEVFGHRVEKTSYFTEGKYDSIINFDFLWDDVPANIPNRLNQLDFKFADYAAKMNTDPTFAVLNQLSSHDTTLYGTDFKNARNNMINAGTALLLAPGAAQIYYGDESGRPYGPYPNGPADVGARCNRAPTQPCDIEAGTRSKMNWNSMNQTYLAHWRKVGQFRARHISVGAGAHIKLQDGPYAFARTYEQDGISDKIVAAIEAKGPSTINVSSVWPNGTLVRDFYTGNTATVVNGRVTFTPHSLGVMLLENVNAPGPQSSAFASPGGGDFFTDTSQVKLILRNATEGKYTLDGRDPKRSGVTFRSGDVITIGSNMKLGDMVALRMYANGPTGEDSETYIYKKAQKQQLTIHFKRPLGWGTPQLFYYEAKPSAPSISWNTAPTMRDTGKGFFSFTINGASSANLLFKDSLGNQLPAANQPGFFRNKEGYYDNGVWKDGSPHSTGEQPPIAVEPDINPALAPPTNLRLTKQDLNALTLSWAPSTSSNVAGYRIYRNGNFVGTANSTVFTDERLLADFDYEYNVRAIDSIGKMSTESEFLRATTAADGDDNTIEDPFLPEEGDELYQTITLEQQDLNAIVTGVQNGVAQYTTDNADQKLRFKVPASMLTTLSTLATQFRFNTPKYSYTLPLKEINVPALASELKTTADKMALFIYFDHADEQMTNDFLAEMTRLNTIATSDLIQFKVEARADSGTSKEVTEYVDSFAPRTITLEVPPAMSNNRLTALQYNPQTKTVRFAPVTFATVNNKKVATVRLMQHPYLAIVDSTRTFSDISTSPARADIELLASKRLLNGVNNTQFGPQNFVTRAEFVTMLVNALGLQPDASTLRFSDVRPGNWFAGAVGTAVKFRMVGGFTDGTFKPNDRITRTQMTVMIDNALRVAGAQVQITNTQVASTLASYVDGRNVPAWAQVPVAKAFRSGMVRGTTRTNGLHILPNEQIRRAEAASAIRGMLTGGRLMN